MRLLLRVLIILTTVCANKVQVDLVLSHYNEPVSDVIATVDKIERLMIHGNLSRVFLYSHSQTSLEGVPEWWIVNSGPNVGREAENYLSFLVDNLHSLNELVFFSQSRPDAYMEDKLWPRLHLVTNQTGMIGLSIWETQSCDGSIYPGLGPLIQQIYAMATGNFCHGTWRSFYNGEFVVSRKRIQKHARHFYETLLEATRLPRSEDWIHKDQQPNGGWPSTPSNPALAYALERTWNVIFRCFTPKEPCCLGNERCIESSCQCLDY